jgi:CheY-like chemotaxis protein
LRVLLAEDEVLIAMLFQDALESEGHEVVHALSGDEALHVAVESEAPFDMLMTDLRMPGIGGEMLISRLRTTWPGLPVLVLTGSPPRGGVADLAVGPGPLRLLVKPVGPAEMLRAVGQLMLDAGSLTR